MKLPLSLCTKKNLISDLGAWVVLLDVNLEPLLNYPEWVKGKLYEIGDNISYNGVAYSCKIAHTSEKVYPPNDQTTWEEAGILRMCQAQYLENVEWNSYTYTRFPFDIDAVSESNTGEVPTATLKVSNINGLMEQYADIYAGFKNAKVTIRVIHNSAINEINVPTHTFTIMTSSTSDEWMSFSLGAENPYNKRVMRDVVYKMFCRYEKFMGDRCRFGQNIWFAGRSYYGNQIVFDRLSVNDEYKPYLALNDISREQSTDDLRACVNANWQPMEWTVGNYSAESFRWFEGVWYEVINTRSSSNTDNPVIDNGNWKILTCDRSLDACKNKFHNLPYFGGFPGLAIGDFIQW